MVRGDSAPGRRPTVRTAGRSGRDNAGTSSDKAGEKPARRNPRVLGKVNPPRVRTVPKLRPKAYAKDNRLIFLFRRGDVMSDGGTERLKHRPRSEVRVQARRKSDR